jgi:putative membrane protein
MIIKLVFVTILIFYTAYCQKILLQMMKGSIKFSDFKLRLWNEFATLLLISIVSLAVLKTTLSWIKAIIIFMIIGILLFSLIKIYRSYINSKN